MLKLLPGLNVGSCSKCLPELNPTMSQAHRSEDKLWF